jgi:hypothetical protein
MVPNLETVLHLHRGGYDLSVVGALDFLGPRKQKAPTKIAARAGRPAVARSNFTRAVWPAGGSSRAQRRMQPRPRGREGKGPLEAASAPAIQVEEFAGRRPPARVIALPHAGI